jgi:ribulose-5-phosphate 4-epimerase/fuculose-1-phosphate aldolase
MSRATFICRSALMVLGTVFLWGCTAPGTAETQQPPKTQQAAPHPEQALIEDLVVANRMLGRDLRILDIQGHVTARSRVNPNHYYIARFVSPGGASVSDFIENDLDSKPVQGPRTDQAREIYLHGEIYKARPDVMAIVHAHTPEFVAYAMSSVPLWNGDTRVPVWDIRPFNNGRSGIVSSPALGRAMAEALGRSEAVLLWGHGIALTGTSLPEAISRVEALRNSAQLQQAAVAVGAAWTPQARPTDAAGIARTWEYYKRSVLKNSNGRVPASPEPTPEKPADPDQQTAHDLVLANRILVSDELSILDTLGHVSVRNPRDPNSYFVAPRVAAGAVTARDVVQRNITKPDPDDRGFSIDDEIYKARPDVKAVLYARTPEIAAFTTGSATLRPIVNGAAFIGDGLPVFNLAGLDPAKPLLANPALGQGIAAALGKARGVLLTAHGIVLTAGSIYNLVDQAYQLRSNAIIQRQAIALRGNVAYLNERPAPPPPPNAPQQPAPTGPAEGRSWIYWSQNVSLD